MGSLPIKLISMIVAASMLSGCATVTESKQTFATCRAVDTATTIAIIGKGGIELNPIMSGVIGHGYVPFIGIEIAITAIVMNLWEGMNRQEKATINAISCYPAVVNLGVI